MKKLLEFLVSNITSGKNGEEFVISQEDQDGKMTLNISVDPSIIGLVIGKEGKTIKNIRRIVAVRAVLEGKSVNISVNEN